LSKIDNFKDELKLADLDLERTKILLDQKVLSLKDYEDKQKQVLQLKREFEDLNIFFDQTKITISELEKDLVLLDIKESQRLQSLKESLYEKYRTLITGILNWEQLYLIKSPIEGTISFFKYRSTNQYVKRGDEIFTIIPSMDNNKLIGRLFMPIKNSGKVQVGQEVNICLDNFPCEEFGKLRGVINKVSQIPADGLYAIEVNLDGMQTSYQKDLDFKQEMEGSAQIITKDLRLIERIFNMCRNLKDV
jgi:multidrug resistance efflux pump